MTDVHHVDQSHDDAVDSNRQRGGKKLLSRLVAAAVLAFAVLSIGFMGFLSSIDAYSDDRSHAVADGIVVLTGGFARLEPAVELLKQKRGERLLVSGVNPKTNDELLQNVLKVDDALYDCCIDIDQDALDTIGNAVGTAHWAASKNYSSLIVVTNDYHMPRSLMELQRTLEGVRLTPYAVSNDHSDDASLSEKADRYRVLIGEYGKYIASLGRGLLGPQSTNGSTVAVGNAAGW